MEMIWQTQGRPAEQEARLSRSEGCHPLRAALPRHGRGGAGFPCRLPPRQRLPCPLAVRRMIDHGFARADGIFINSYFAMLLVIWPYVLALASAMRYYFVITLGERVVADLRSRMSFACDIAVVPPSSTSTSRGEIVSRLTADTTQIKSAFGVSSLDGAAQPHPLSRCAMGMMIMTSPKLSALVLGAIPLIVFPLVGFGRSVRQRSRAAQDTLAQSLGLCR